jgi:hypothetical protein
MSDADDAGLLRQLRDAEAALDERPAPRVRQAVLRAAVQAARPDVSPSSTPVAPPARAARIRAGWGWPPRSWGWSIPAAASVLVGAIAVGVVSEMQRTAAPTVATVAASATPTEKKASAPEAAAPPSPAAAAAPSASGAGTVVAGPARPAIRSLTPAAESSNAPPAASVAQAPLSNVLLGPARIRPERSQAYAALPKQTQSPAEDSAPRQETRSAPAAQTAAQVQSPAPAMARVLTEPQTPQQWVDRIVAMRRAGRQDEADRELVLLRKRYPEFVVPAAALRPPG